jgi:hypothetical protein
VAHDLANARVSALTTIFPGGKKFLANTIAMDGDSDLVYGHQLERGLTLPAEFAKG